MALNTSLVSTWKPKSASGSYPTYRIDADGNYFAAYPSSAFSFDGSGTKLTWGGSTYTKTLGKPGELIGVWIGDADGEEWNFRADGTVTVHFSATEEYFGNFEVRNSGASLWYEEFRSIVTTSGARINFDPPYASDREYSFTVDAQYWSIFEIATGTLVFEYEKV